MTLWLPPPPSHPSSGPYRHHHQPLHHTQVSARSLPFPRVLTHATSGIFASPATFSTMTMTKLKMSRRGNRAHPGELSPITIPATTSLSAHSRMTCHITRDVSIVVHRPQLGWHVTTTPTSTDHPRRCPPPPPWLPRHNHPHLHQSPLIAAHRHHRTQALPTAPPAAPRRHSTSAHTQSCFLWRFE